MANFFRLLFTQKCTDCNAKFNSTEERNAHAAEWHQFKCGLCDLVFVTDLSRQQHQLGKHFLCQHCKRPFTTSVEREKHLEFAHNFNCFLCNFVCYTEAERQDHSREKHNFRCEYCNKTYLFAEDRDLHVQYAHNMIRDLCNDTFNSLQVMQEEHDLSKHLFKCQECEETFNSEVNRSRHIMENHTFLCPYKSCIFVFRSEVEVTEHVRSLHVKCDFFDEQLAVKEEKEMHASVNQSICDDLQFSKPEISPEIKIVALENSVKSSFNDSVQEIAQISVDQQSTVNCENYFTSANVDVMKEHIAMCFNLMCTICDSKFQTSQQKREHFIEKHVRHFSCKEPCAFQVKCDQCKMAFACNALKAEHLKKYHIVGCNKCNKLFNTTESRNQHYIDCHINSFIKIPTIELLNEHITKDSFVCDICVQVFETDDLYNEHYKNLHTHQCSSCLDVFPTEEALNGHLNDCRSLKGETNKDECIKDNDELYTSIDCPDNSASAEDTNKHIQEVPSDAVPVANLLQNENPSHKCVLCNVDSFSSIEDLNEHVQAQHNDEGRQYDCLECKITFVSEKELMAHNKHLHLFNCDFCEKVFGSEVEKVEHEKDNHQFKCTECEEIFATDSAVDQHIRNVHIFHCIICNEVFTTNSDKEQHVRYVHTLHKCADCIEEFKGKEELDIHIQTRHNFKCNACDLIYPTNLKMQEHYSNIHSTSVSKTLYTCHLCLKTYINAVERNNHLASEHVKCNICLVMFNSKESKKQHVKSCHTFKCLNCTSVFPTAAGRDKHFVANHNFVCNVCRNMFKSAKDRDQHVRYSHSIKCEFCAQAFLNAELRDVHVNKMHALCNICKRVFNTVEHRDQHIKDAHYIIICDFCSEKFPDAKALEVHIRNKHAVCSWCNKVFKAAEHRDQHIQSSHRLKCNYCVLVFSNPALLDEHVKANHNPNVPVYKCPECPMKFLTPEIPREHYITGHGYMDCNLCPKISKTQAQKEQHYLDIHNCRFCAYTFSTLQARNDHILQAHTKCNICCATFKSEEQKQQHIVDKHHIKCDHCNASFSTTTGIEEHCRLVHLFKCHSCGKDFVTEAPRNQHFADKHMFNCDVCNGKFSTIEAAEKHTLQFHSTLFECYECSGMWANEGDRDDHVRKCHSIVCNICEELFESDEAQEIHYIETHFYKCKVCGGVWATAKARTEHIQQFHAIICTMCNETFATSAELDAHIKQSHNRTFVDRSVTALRTKIAKNLQHEAEDHKFRCSLSDDDTSNQAKKNQHFHLKYSWWDCTVCDKTFKSEMDKDQHVTFVHLHQCEACERVFNSESVLNRHFQLTHEWPCDLCNKVCTSETSLKIHCDLGHGVYHAKSEEAQSYRNVCSVCYNKFDSESDLVDHYAAVHT